MAPACAQSFHKSLFSRKAGSIMLIGKFFRLTVANFDWSIDLFFQPRGSTQFILDPGHFNDVNTYPKINGPPDF